MENCVMSSCCVHVKTAATCGSTLLVFFAMPCHTVPCRAAPEHSFAKPGKSGGARQFPGAIKHWTTLDSLRQIRQIRQIRQCFWHFSKFLEISPMISNANDAFPALCSSRISSSSQLGALASGVKALPEHFRSLSLDKL